jgi:ATP-dependent 26S proteasome regulatory subunit
MRKVISGGEMMGDLYLINLVRMLREELQLLQEQGSLVGEVVKAMDKKKVLVKVNYGDNYVDRC